jgi:hypothetical protein
VHVQHRRARWLGLALAAAFALLGCSSPGGEPVSVTTPYAQVTPAAAPSSDRPSAPSSQKPAPNDLKKGRTTRSLKTGPVKVKVKYSLRNRVQQWSPGVAQPLSVSLTARSSRRMVQGQWVAGQKIYLSRVTAHLEISDATGHLDSPNPLVDRADVSPGFLVTSPTYYDQVFTLPPLPARATELTIDFRYEILLLQPSSSPRDYEKRTAIDTLVISRP